MPRRASWKELVVGLLALAVLAGVGFLVLVFARVGRLHGSTFRLYALTGEARGVIRGSEVWLGGQKVGVVKDVTFMSPMTPAKDRLLIVMDVLSSERQGIRMNSTAQVRSGGTLISSPVVYLSIGSNASRMVAPGDTLRTLPQSDLETMSSDVAIASRQFPDIINNVKLLNKGLQSARGTLGAFGVEHGGVQLARVQNQASRLMSRASRPAGTIGLALGSSTSLAERARRVMSRADSVRALLSSDKSSLGRFRKDSTLLREVADIRNELDIVRARLTSPTGTLGRARTDSALFAAVAGVQREMTLIMADIHRRPLRYIHF
jgi:phospholipid/cholesterol/gamma-HCH transport system substrate-binding protein